MINRVKIVWLAILVSEIIYFAVLLLLAATNPEIEGSLSTKIQNWKGFSDGSDIQMFTPFLLISVLIGIVIGVFIALMSEKWMRGSLSAQNFIQRMLIGTSVAAIPGIMGLVYALLTGSLLYSGVLFSISFGLKFKFYPGLYAETLKQFE